MDEIYVQIPAYRDRELSTTLLELFAKARHPERLRVAVLWQHAEGESLHPAVHDLPQLEIEAVPYQRSEGCNWARNLLQQNWRGEPFTLLIDSHQRFVPDWDANVVAMFRGLQDRGVERPILTAYLPSYDPERDPGARKKRPYKIYPLARDDGILTKLTSFPIPFWKTLQNPIEADFASLHFLFADGRFNREIRFDPGIYFFGDEIVTSVRAFTTGYDLYHPHLILGWHCYDRKTRVAHWNDHRDWHIRHRQTLDKLRSLFLGRYEGAYGLGETRSLIEYEERAMLSLVAS